MHGGRTEKGKKVKTSNGEEYKKEEIYARRSINEGKDLTNEGDIRSPRGGRDKRFYERIYGKGNHFRAGVYLWALPHQHMEFILRDSSQCYFYLHYFYSWAYLEE